MKLSNRIQWLLTLGLLYSVPGLTATVYKSIDQNGVVTYSDTRPEEHITVETIVFDDEPQLSSELAEQRLEDMRVTTDRMAADRMAREKHRADLRQQQAQTAANQAAQQYVEYDDDETFFTGYYDYPVRRPWRRPNHRYPEHPGAQPPLRPPTGKPPHGVRPLPGNDYPASLVRKHYLPKVRQSIR